MRKTRLKFVSDKRKKEFATYKKKRETFLSENKWCEARATIFCENTAKDVHHSNGRNGKRLLKVKDWLAVCRSCHTWIHDHPREAREKGWLK